MKVYHFEVGFFSMLKFCMVYSWRDFKTQWLSNSKQRLHSFFFFFFLTSQGKKQKSWKQKGILKFCTLPPLKRSYPCFYFLPIELAIITDVLESRLGFPRLTSQTLHLWKHTAMVPLSSLKKHIHSPNRLFEDFNVNSVNFIANRKGDLAWVPTKIFPYLVKGGRGLAALNSRVVLILSGFFWGL